MTLLILKTINVLIYTYNKSVCYNLFQTADLTLTNLSCGIAPKTDNCAHHLIDNHNLITVYNHQ